MSTRKTNLPDGLDAAGFARAIADFKGALGAEWVSVSEHDTQSYADPYPIVDPAHYLPSAALKPDGVEDLRKILAIANRHRIPLSPISRGKNNNYGGPAPRQPGAVIVDLGRMNRILEVNEAAGYALLEPGVSFFDLHQHLQKIGSNLCVSPPELGWGSVVGNALEHGVGYTPYGDHWGVHCGMEVVLADGDVVRTGMGAMSNSNAWQLFQYGYGPYLDGLFTQSNYGIVTKLGMWLMPRPPAARAYMISFPRESDLEIIVEIMRPLRMAMIVQNGAPIETCLHEATVVGTKKQFYDGEGAVPDSLYPQIMKQLNVGWWNIYGTQFGTPEMMDLNWNIIKGAFSQIPGAQFYFEHELPNQVSMKFRSELSRGIPNMTTLKMLDWLPNAGHLDFSPVSPTSGAHAMKLYRLLKTRLSEQGYDFIGGCLVGWREMHTIVPLLYDIGDPLARQRTHQLFGRLVDECAAAGYGEYRGHLEFMDKIARSYDFNDHALLRLQGRLKDALDPNGILAPGKQGIWPKHLREQH
jgi:4-cresol dehydrogenase (hydroxylating) flavoprotein subunit